MNIDVPFQMNSDISGSSNDEGESGEDKGDDEERAPDAQDSKELVPLPQSGGIQELREKLHARMSALRRGGPANVGDEPGSRDELIEERRRHRAALREKRRKETKEKIKREEAARGKKGKEKERNQGPTTKVRLIECFPGQRLEYTFFFRLNS